MFGVEHSIEIIEVRLCLVFHQFGKNRLRSKEKQSKKYFSGEHVALLLYIWVFGYGSVS